MSHSEKNIPTKPQTTVSQSKEQPYEAKGSAYHRQRLAKVRQHYRELDHRLPQKQSFRLSDYERNALVEQLTVVAADGRLDCEELEERISVVLQAKTNTDLAPALYQLPIELPTAAKQNLPSVKSKQIDHPPKKLDGTIIYWIPAFLMGTGCCLYFAPIFAALAMPFSTILIALSLLMLLSLVLWK